MQLTRQGEYAIRTVFALAQQEGKVVTQRDIAQSQDIPEAFLAKIAQILQRRGLITNLRGSRGGMTLARPAAEINLRNVVEAVEGPIALNQCLSGPGACSRQGTCPIHPVWDRAQKAMLEELEKVSLADLVGQSS